MYVFVVGAHVAQEGVKNAFGFCCQIISPKLLQKVVHASKVNIPSCILS